MQMNLKKLVGAAAITGALGLPAIGMGAGVANAATAAPSIPGPVHTVQTPAEHSPTQARLVNWDGHDDWRWGDRGGWRGGGWGGPGWGGGWGGPGWGGGWGGPGWGGGWGGPGWGGGWGWGC
jgi:hypothetical protein